MYTRILLSILIAVNMAYSQYNIVITKNGTSTPLKIDVADIKSITFEKIVKTEDYIVSTKTYKILDTYNKPIYLAKVWMEIYMDYDRTCYNANVALNANNTKMSGYTDIEGNITLTEYSSKITYINGVSKHYCTPGANVRCDKGNIVFVTEMNGIYIYKIKL